MDRDIMLWVEVVRYWRAIAEVHSLTSQLVSLKRKFNNATWEVQNSGKRLAMADAYGCLELHVLYGVQATEDITNEDTVYSMAYNKL
jgi:hypothetical protein